MILTAGKMQKRQLTTGTFYKGMTAPFLQRGICVSEHFTAKTVNAFVEIGATGIKIVMSERTVTEKAKPQGNSKFSAELIPRLETGIL